MAKIRVAREREKGGNPPRYYRRKYQKAVGQKLPAAFDVHHLDLNWQNIAIENLVAVPKKLHAEFHSVDKLIVHSGGEFYVALHVIGRKHTVERLRRIAEQMKAWLDYRDFLLGKMPLNIYNLKYD
jgi:hypothetical protein